LIGSTRCAVLFLVKISSKEKKKQTYILRCALCGGGVYEKLIVEIKMMKINTLKKGNT
jgi:hypothetical protein